MKRPTLVAEKRTVIGKKVKQLRRDGILPANIYGKEMKSVAVQVKTAEFQALYKEVGETGVVNIEVEGTKYPSLMKNLYLNYKLHTPLHIDFHKVNLKEKIKATVPVVLIGEAPAVNDKLGMLLQPVSEVEVEALPDNLPENLEVSIDGLTELNATVTVADIKVPEDVTVLTDPTQAIAKIAEIIEEPEPEAAEGEEGEATEGETAEEGKEGSEATSESAEAKDEEKKEEGK